MEFGQLMTDILVDVSCKFEMYIFKISQVINENVLLRFFMYWVYVLSKNKKNIIFFPYENYFFTTVKNCSILHGRVFVMIT